MQQPQQQMRTDSLVGDLVSKLISKIENDGTQQTQQYSKEVQPITNDNSNTNSGQTSGNTQTITNNIYPNSGQTTTTTKDTPDTTKKTVVETAAGTALSAATGFSAVQTGEIAGGFGAVVARGVGTFAGRKKLGQAFENTFSGKKSGGNATISRLLREDGKHERGKDQNCMELPSELPSQPTSRQTSFDVPRTLSKQPPKIQTLQEEITPPNNQRVIEEAGGTGMKTSKLSPRAISTQTTPKPSPRATPRPSLEGTPLNILLHPSPRYMEPTTSLSPGSAAGVIRARTSRNSRTFRSIRFY